MATTIKIRVDDRELEAVMIPEVDEDGDPMFSDRNQDDDERIADLERVREMLGFEIRRIRSKNYATECVERRSLHINWTSDERLVLTALAVSDRRGCTVRSIAWALERWDRPVSKPRIRKAAKALENSSWISNRKWGGTANYEIASGAKKSIAKTFRAERLVGALIEAFDALQLITWRR